MLVLITWFWLTGNQNLYAVEKQTGSVEFPVIRSASRLWIGGVFVRKVNGNCPLNVCCLCNLSTFIFVHVLMSSPVMWVMFFFKGDSSRRRNESFSCSEGGSQCDVRVSISSPAPLYADADGDRLRKELHSDLSSSYGHYLSFHEEVTSLLEMNYKQ